MKKLIVLLFVSVLTFSSFSIEAERLGGRKSVGKQSTNVTNKNVAPVTKAAPAVAAPAAPVATPVSKPWGSMLGGVAAGLGLAWLASSLGMSAAFGNILLTLLVGSIILVIIGWFIHRRKIEPALKEK